MASEPQPETQAQLTLAQVMFRLDRVAWRLDQVLELLTRDESLARRDRGSATVDPSPQASPKLAGKRRRRSQSA